MLDFYKVIFSSHLYMLQIFNLRPSLGVSFSFRPEPFIRLWFRPLTGFHTYFEQCYPGLLVRYVFIPFQLLIQYTTIMSNMAVTVVEFYVRGYKIQ